MRILCVHYAFVRLVLWKTKTILFCDVASIVTIALWIYFWRYQIDMREWEKTVVAPIRIDLILWWVPILYTATIICLLSSWLSLFRKFTKATKASGTNGTA